MRDRHWAGTALVAAAAILLSGCTASAFPAFDREPTEADVLPADASYLDDGQFDAFDLTSLRFVADHEEIKFYLIRSLDGTPCLYVAAGRGSSIACGRNGVVSTQSPAGNFELGPAPIGEKSGWTVVSENIRVLDK